MCIGKCLDPNLRKTHQKISKLMDNQSKRYHYHIVPPIWDYNLTIPVILMSNELNLIPNSYLSIEDVTMDFSIVII